MLHSRTPTDYYSKALDKSKADGSVEYTADGPGMQRLMHNMRISVDVNAQESYEIQQTPKSVGEVAALGDVAPRL